MKVILEKSYMGLGEAGDLVEVRNGYARNFLIPQKIAVTATEQNVRVFQDKARKMQEKKELDRKGAKELLGQLEKVSLVIRKRVSEDGRLYGSVTTKEIEEAFIQKGATVDRRQVVLGQQIKMIGEYNILVKLVGGLKASVPLKVEGEVVKEAPAADKN
jgi:large subunit ribosomal protein L9